ncbi:MAG: methyltransferase domain-containing protein [Cyanobacteriota bacterium]
MNENNAEVLEKIRKQFDTGPYPRKPLEDSPKDDPSFLYIHNLVTPYYLRNQKFVETEGKVILDAGCGSGYKCLALAHANPGARIIGIDLSEESVKLAKKRLDYHGFLDTEFHALLIEELPQLGIQFDYINCDDVLYLLPDPKIGLEAMQSVLKPEGIIRANLHSLMGRAHFFRAQTAFTMMGLMDENPGELEIDLVKQVMGGLKDNVLLKRQAWGPQFENSVQIILANYLLQGDKGSTIPEMFSALRAANLEFIRMVNWRQWDLMDLFKEPENLPVFLAMSLPETSIEQQLHLYELLNPVHRLFDFWCGHSNQAQPFVPVEEWIPSDWQNAQVHLHPQLKTSIMKEDLLGCITQLHPFELSKYLPIAGQTSVVDSTIAACILLPLLESAQTVASLVERWQKLRPVNPATSEPTTQEEAFAIITQALSGLEAFGYVLLECQP